jgi:glutathione S-transferase
MIKLYQFAPAWEVPNLSPFCIKTEIYLKMVNLPYEIVSAIPPKAPKGKLPFIEDKNKKIADSRFIIDYLNDHYGCDLDKELTGTEKATATAFQRLLEDDLYWAVLYIRWVVPSNWKVNREAVFGKLPLPIKYVLGNLVRKQIKKQIHGHGMGRHSEQEIYWLGNKSLTALSDFLADKPYFMGDRPTILDASAFGMLANIIWCPIESPLKVHALKLKNLVAFCDRMKQLYYSETITKVA